MVREMDLDALIREFRSPLTGLLSSWGAAPRDAIELAQDTFAEGYLSRERFKGDWADHGAVGGWLCGIAQNLFHASRRKATGGGRLFSLDEVGEPAEGQGDETSNSEDDKAVLREALASLKGPWRTVLTMRYAEGASLATIGALLGMSERAVEGRLRRARAALKEQLQKTGTMENRS
ncbi:MAG: sigma-70 family RNA polymerase sigma factor [Myxococcota bacterium]|nr:sigma-70 family RNA polymerase sigma factor [Myxococcota bacterium]